MKRPSWLICVAACLVAPAVGWLLGGFLFLGGLNLALKRFEQAEIDSELDAMRDEWREREGYL